MLNKTFLLSFILILIIKLSYSTICRDGSICPGLSTCCLTPRGVGCCPYQNAVCCGDGIHCCPYGFICGPGTCYRSEATKYLGDLMIDPTVISITDNTK